jgi:hypothetical protein
MLSRFFARLVLAASFLVATQIALQHPLEHLRLSSAPAQHQHCDACIAFASIGPAAVSHAVPAAAVSSDVFSATAQAAVFTAAFTPHFRSQAPPALL